MVGDNITFADFMPKSGVNVSPRCSLGYNILFLVKEHNQACINEDIYNFYAFIKIYSVVWILIQMS